LDLLHTTTPFCALNEEYNPSVFGKSLEESTGNAHELGEISTKQAQKKPALLQMPRLVFFG